MAEEQDLFEGENAVANGDEVEFLPAETKVITPETLSLDQFRAEAERMVDIMHDITLQALKHLRPEGVVVMGGRPFVEEQERVRVAGRMAGLFRVHIPNPQRERIDTVDEWGPSYYIRYSGPARLIWQRNNMVLMEIPVVGTGSASDTFFRKAHGVVKPLEEVREYDVDKKARTNMIANAIGEFFGLKKVTWQELARYAGIKKDEVEQRVEYKGGSASTPAGGNGATQPTELTPAQKKKRTQIGDWFTEAATGLIDSAAQKGELHKTLEIEGEEPTAEEMERGIKQLRGDMLYNLSIFKGREERWVGGLRSLTDLKPNRVNVIYDKTKTAYNTWKETGIWPWQDTEEG